jgi:membrane protein DedA with SNARE-associated domain
MALALSALAFSLDLPDWLQSPSWFRPLTRTLGHFVATHQSGGLFLVVLAEELGIPLPAPGDVAITWGGYLTTTGAIPLAAAYIAVVGGATLGSFCLFALSRRFGHPFIHRFGPYLGLRPSRLERAEAAFQRWGPWAIILGRHVPGMRIVLSALSGVFNVPARVFVPCVIISSTIWAAIFINLGRALGRNSRYLFRLLPVHLLPLVLLVLAALYVGWLIWDHRRDRQADMSESHMTDPPQGGGAGEARKAGG